MEKNKKAKVHITRKTLAIIVTVIICVLYFVAVTSIGILFHTNNKATYLSGMLDSAFDEYKSSAKKDSIYVESNKKVVDDILGYAAFVFSENGGYSREAMDEVNNNIGRYMFLFYGKMSFDEKQNKYIGHIFNEQSEIDFAEYNLSDEEIYQLLQTGRLEARDTYFSSVRIGNNEYLISSWLISDIFKKQKAIALSYPNSNIDIFDINTDTYVIEDASDATYIGKKLTGDSVDVIKKAVPGDLNYESLSDMNAVFMISAEYENHVFCAYEETSDFWSDYGRNVMLPLILGELFFIILLFYMLRFLNKQGDDEKNYKDCLRLFGKAYVNKVLISHIVGIQIFAIALIISSTVYVKTLVNYVNNNINTTTNLSVVDSLLELNTKNNEAMEKEYLDNKRILVDAIADYYVIHPEKLSNISLSKLVRKLPHTNSITFFDLTGTCVNDAVNSKTNSSLGVTIGYTLSKDEDTAEYICWDVLNGNKSIASYNLSSNGELYVVGRRQDKEGIIRLGTDETALLEYAEMASRDAIISNSFFADSLKIYIDLNSQDNYYLYEEGKLEPTFVANTLPDEVLVNGYSGINRIGGAKYYIITRKVNGGTGLLISAAYLPNLSGFYDGLTPLTVIAFFLLLGVVFILLSINKARDFYVLPKIETKNLLVRHSLEEQMMDVRFIKVVKGMTFATFLMIAILLGIDSVRNEASLIRFLYKDQWSKGINLFSITMIIVTLAVVIICGWFVQILVEFFTKNMGPRGVTIGKLVVSIAKFLMLIMIIIFILTELGFNMSTLLAGAGIIGAMVSFCAQQTVNDFLTGFFIVFEGLFNIGDWITVKDFRGQVVEIGIRTTKVAAGGNIRIINNSELKDVMLMSHNRSGAVCYIDVAYKEDINQVMELIKNSTKKYVQENEFILDGPYVDGVTALEDSGVRLCLWAMAEQEYVNSVERTIYKVTKEIFSENNIEIPFMQVTIHKDEK